MEPLKRFGAFVDQSPMSPLDGTEKRILMMFWEWLEEYAPEYHAAPELLEACWAMRLWVDEPQQITLEQAMARVDAALAKAKGEADAAL